jgi:hypothetical protein
VSVEQKAGGSALDVMVLLPLPWLTRDAGGAHEQGARGAAQLVLGLGLGQLRLVAVAAALVVHRLPGMVCRLQM